MPPTTEAVSHAVNQAVRALPDGHRQALLLSRAGLTYYQVADRLGVPVERVRDAVLQSVRLLTEARLSVEVGPQVTAN